MVLLNLNICTHVIEELLERFAKKLVSDAQVDSSLILQTHDAHGKCAQVTRVTLLTKYVSSYVQSVHVCSLSSCAPPPIYLPSYIATLCYDIVTYITFSSQCMNYKCPIYRWSSWSINIAAIASYIATTYWILSPGFIICKRQICSTCSQ